MSNEVGFHEALILIASDAFEDILTTHFKNPLMVPYLNEMLEILLVQMKNTQNVLLIELAFTLVKKQYSKLKEVDDKGMYWFNRIIITCTDILTIIIHQNKRDVYFKTFNTIE